MHSMASPHLFFVPGLKYQELHLPRLAKLWQMCARPDAIEALTDAPTAPGAG